MNKTWTEPDNILASPNIEQCELLRGGGGGVNSCMHAKNYIGIQETVLFIKDT